MLSSRLCAELVGGFVVDLDETVVGIGVEEPGLCETAEASHAGDVVSLRWMHSDHGDTGVLFFQDPPR